MQFGLQALLSISQDELWHIIDSKIMLPED